MKIVDHRLYNQQLATKKLSKVEELVKWMGAIQAQDYSGGLWSVGMRLPDATLADVEKAIASRKIIRTWPMRGTLHFVPAKDAKWMLQLLTPRVIQRSLPRYKELGLTEKIFAQSETLLVKALEANKQLTRPEIYQLLKNAGIVRDSQRAYHILGYLAQKAVICFGNKQGKQQTFVLFDEWISKSKKLSKEEALAEITKRYFISRGPATLQDFMWWSGLPAVSAKAGIESVNREVISENINGQTYWMYKKAISAKIQNSAHLLQPYDEFLIAYKDRSASLAPTYVKKYFASKNGIFSPLFIIDGQVAGTWKRITKKDSLVVTAKLFRTPNKAEKEEVSNAAEHYGKFLGTKINFTTKGKSRFSQRAY